jgi:murein DD-endopeptidase MepM/ murein hydrolase activator NlpD
VVALPFAAVVPTPRYKGRTPKTSSGFRSTDRPSHDGVDLMFKRIPFDPGPPQGAVPFTSRGHFHPEGLPALALGPGVVSTSGQITTGGYVVIEHPGGWTSQYMHLARRDVKVGDRVKTGQPIGIIGFDTRPGGYKLIHLHFQLRKDGVLVNPAPILATLPVVDAPGNMGWLVAGGVAVAAGLLFARFVR